ncbi:cation transport ATPase, P-type [Candidatus Phytoplasma luffae]|uniref:Magnesium-transporting ATPase, P-type 1 n=1 Tax=Loofah witches'-broom phytoplasma TaxID=35773 RepID=A0A975FJ31_LOWBP|nr:magnesium-translocating P-type ATPase [Candidatus Phytoplasma luffae]QTX02757.1 cation transport ATPase, P-type [Candidatus Phytoplasma luffae]
MKKERKKILCSLSIEDISNKNINENFQDFKTCYQGLSWDEVKKRRLLYGDNVLEENRISLFSQFISILLSPFNIILLFIITFYSLRNVLSSDRESVDYSTIFFITFFLFLSVIINLMQISKFSKISEKLKNVIRTKVIVKRDNKISEVDLNEIVVGDIVLLSTGEIIPADIKLFESKNFFVRETSLTGENRPIKKDASDLENYSNILEDKRIIFMGNSVISGFAQGLVIAIGNETYLGKINRFLINKKTSSILEKKINSISKILTLCIFFIFPLICLLNYLKNPSNFDFWEVCLFALTMVLGITPEMLPLIVTTSFLTGIFTLYKKNVIVKNLNSMQSFGCMNVLFMDKTGTLTEDGIIVGHCLDLNNRTNYKVLEYSFYNSYFQRGIRNNIQKAIIRESEIKINNQTNSDFLESKFQKINELSFDFKTRINSVLLKDKQDKDCFAITQGAVEEVLGICNYYMIPDESNPLSCNFISIDKMKVLKQIQNYNEKGFRVVGIACQKINNIDDFDNLYLDKKMVFMGFLTFLDSPKKSAIAAISDLKKYNVDVKMLTGDNPFLSQIIATKINLDNDLYYLLGSQIDTMTDDELYQKALNIKIFAKLNPNQKERIVSLFKKKGDIVGFIGDGINDTPAMRSSDFAISVDNAVDLAKETSDIIFLTKDLTVIKDGIIEGRKNYINMLKYIQLTLAANFGNVLTVLCASYFLPFLPFLPIQILFLNLIYDFSCFGIPFDRVDSKYLKKSNIWNFKNIVHFMLLFGFNSFIFDMLFFYIILKEDPNVFQYKWFVFSIWTQIFNIFILRTDNNIKDAKISFRLLFLLITGGFLSIILPLFLKNFLHFVIKIDLKEGIIFILFLILYIICITILKKIFISFKKSLF